MVYFREILETDAASDTKAKLPIGLGKDIGGDPVIVDLARIPHLLIAGTTGGQVGRRQHHDPVAPLPARRSDAA